jgi:hypothetical protein
MSRSASHLARGKLVPTQPHIKPSGNGKRLFREQHRVPYSPCRPQDHHTRVLKRGFEVERDKGIVLNHEDQATAKTA